MLNTRKKFLSFLMACILLVSLIPSASAASDTRKGYTISNSNVTVYSDMALSKRLGTIYPTDELTIITVTSKYVKLTYPLSTGGTKTGYVPTSAVLTQTSGTSKTATAKITTYRRNSTSYTYGSISAGDVVLVLGTKGDFTQVKYPVSGGYKYAFIKTSDANKLGSSGTSVEVSNGTYYIYSALASNKVVDIDGGSTADGANVQLFEANGTNAQMFTITKQSNGYYQIKNLDGKVLDVYGGEKRSGAIVIQWSWNSGANQQWRFISAGDGYFYIQNALGYYLDVNGGGTANGTNIQVYEGNSTNAQKWKLVSINTNTTSSSTSTTKLSYGLYKNTSAHITCGFDGYTTTSGRHEGIDITCYNGAPVYALTSGTVVRVAYGSNGSSGLSTIAIYDSSTDKTVVYLHTNPLSLSVGQSIEKGQQIATQGWRGVSSASAGHTHVEVRNGRQGYAAKSVGDPTLDNQNPSNYWTSKGYTIQ